MAPPYQNDDFDENSVSGSIDVKLTNLANSEILAWNATNSKWENATNGGGGGVAQNLQQVLTQGNDGALIGGGYLSSRNCKSRSDVLHAAVDQNPHMTRQRHTNDTA